MEVKLSCSLSLLATINLPLIIIFILLVIIFFIVLNTLIRRKKAEQQNNQNKEQIQAIFQAAPDAIIVMDGAGLIDEWNPKAEMLFGWTQNEIIGKRLSDTIIPLRYRDAHDRGLRHFRQSGEGPVLNKTIEIQALNKANVEFDVSLSISPTTVNGKQLFIGFIRDITEQKSIEKQIQKHSQDVQDFVDSMSTLCAKVAKDGKLLLVNKTAMLATGLSTEELLNINFLEGDWWTFDPEVHSRVVQAFKTACSGIACNYDENIFVFGRVLTINFSLIPILKFDGSVDYIVAEGRDITSLKITETELLKRTNQLEIVNAELEAFSYSVSHDLRAPLRAIHGFTKALSEDFTNQPDERAQHMMRAVLRNTAKMGRLIDDLLAFSKLGKKELQITRINMSQLVTNVLNDIKNSLPLVRANIVVLPLESIDADASLMNQVFSNLILNAIKYSEVRDNPEIEIGSREENNMITYYVKDNGVGFDMQYYNKLFGVFQRLHRDEEFEGTGVGLALVKRIISRHNGKVWAEAEVGKGATFYFSLNKKMNS